VGSPNAPGGGVMAIADGAVALSGSGLVDASSTGDNSGGCVDLEGGGDLTIAPTAVIDADGGAVTGNAGGLICLVSGTPDLPGDVQLLPFCTAVGQLACLTPCPVCGNQLIEFPETCDTGGHPDACCNATCRTPFCNDLDACTTDACSVAAGGCTHTRIEGC